MKLKFHVTLDLEMAFDLRVTYDLQLTPVTLMRS